MLTSCKLFANVRGLERKTLWHQFCCSCFAGATCIWAASAAGAWHAAAAVGLAAAPLRPAVAQLRPAVTQLRPAAAAAAPIRSAAAALRVTASACRAAAATEWAVTSSVGPAAASLGPCPTQWHPASGVHDQVHQPLPPALTVSPILPADPCHPGELCTQWPLWSSVALHTMAPRSCGLDLHDAVMSPCWASIAYISNMVNKFPCGGWL